MYCQVTAVKDGVFKRESQNAYVWCIVRSRLLKMVFLNEKSSSASRSYSTTASSSITGAVATAAAPAASGDSQWAGAHQRRSAVATSAHRGTYAKHSEKILTSMEECNICLWLQRAASAPKWKTRQDDKTKHDSINRSSWSYPLTTQFLNEIMPIKKIKKSMKDNWNLIMNNYRNF